MGATESTLAFRKSVFTLFEQRNLTDDSFFSKFYELPSNAEEVFNLFSSKDIRFIRDSAPENLETLCKKLCDRLFRFVELKTPPTKEDVRDVLNCARVLTRLIPFIFETETTTKLDDRVFWAKSETAEGSADDRLGPRLLKATVQLLFFKGLTLSDSAAEQPGVRYVIWEKGVGAANAPPAGAAVVANRIEILRLFLVLLSSVVYVPTGEVLKRVDKWAALATKGLEKKAVLAVLCSLMNVSLNYDPVGWGLIPYNHMLFSDKQEQLVTLSLEVLVVLLNAGGATKANFSGAAPPSDSRRLNFIPQVPSGNNDFRYYAARLYRPEDLAFILDGVTRLLKNPLDVRGTEADKIINSMSDCEHSIHAVVTTTAKTPVANLHENFLIALTNVSPFVKSLTVVTVNKLLSLFMSFSNPGYMMSNESNHKMVFYILDIFNNMIQYQITGNTHLVYAIVRHKDRFHELQDMTFDSAMGELNRIRELKLQRARKMEQAGIAREDSAVSAVAAASQDGQSAPSSPRQSMAREAVPASAAPAASPAGTAAATSTGVASGASSGSSPSQLAASPVLGQLVPASPASSSPTSGAISDKARGKLPASATAEKPKFQPTMDWFNYWKSHLRLTVLLTLVDALGPPIEALCIEKGVNDDRKVVEYLRSGTLVGLLPLPHPIFVRRFAFTDPVRVWLTSFLWGCV
ncbi:hypothetical protein HK405_014744, partial [Cladochytrium tenue]